MSFIKENFDLQLKQQLVFGSVFSASFWGGMLVPTDDKPSSIVDRFYLRGPSSVLVFRTHSVGPQSEGSYLGGEEYWASGLHVYTPLHFLPGQAKAASGNSSEHPSSSMQRTSTTSTMGRTPRLISRSWLLSWYLLVLRCQYHPRAWQHHPAVTELLCPHKCAER